MHFVALFQSAQDGNGVFHGGLVDQYLLETALEGWILLDVLAMFIEGGGTDAPQFAPGQHWFEQVAGIHGAAGRSGTHHGVNFVDEEHDASI